MFAVLLEDMCHQTSSTEVWIGIWHLLGRINCKLFIQMFVTCEGSILNSGCPLGDGKLNHRSLIKNTQGRRMEQLCGKFLANFLQ